MTTQPPWRRDADHFSRQQLRQRLATGHAGRDTQGPGRFADGHDFGVVKIFRFDQRLGGRPLGNRHRHAEFTGHVHVENSTAHHASRGVDRAVLPALPAITGANCRAVGSFELTLSRLRKRGGHGIILVLQRLGPTVIIARALAIWNQTVRVRQTCQPDGATRVPNSLENLTFYLPMTTAEPSSPGLAAQTAAPRTRHTLLLGAALVIVILSLVLEVRPGERVALRGFSDYPLPHTCYSRTLFGVKCPGCGLTRSFIHLAHGDWRASRQVQPVGWLLAAIVLFQLPYRIVLLAGGERWAFGRPFVACFSTAVLGLMLANWVWQLFAGQ